MTGVITKGQGGGAGAGGQRQTSEWADIITTCVSVSFKTLSQL